MKKILFLLLLAAFATTNSKGQGQGNVNILNQTGCDIYVNAYAICPDDCSEYSAQTMIGVTPTGTWPPVNIYSTGSTGYWLPTPPNCSDWQWDYIWIDIICEGTPYTIKVGNPSSPCNANNATDGTVIPQDCADACHGGNTLVQASWQLDAAGDVLVIVW